MCFTPAACLPMKTLFGRLAISSRSVQPIPRRHPIRHLQRSPRQAASGYTGAQESVQHRGSLQEWSSRPIVSDLTVRVRLYEEQKWPSATYGCRIDVHRISKTSLSNKMHRVAYLHHRPASLLQLSARDPAQCQTARFRLPNPLRLRLYRRSKWLRVLY